MAGVRVSYLQRAAGIVWVAPPVRATDEEMNRVLAELTAELKRGSAYVLLFDLTRSAMPNAIQRQKLTAHMRENAERIRRWVRGVGVVVPSAFARGVVTAIFWIAPPGVPHSIFTTRAEATKWAGSLVETAPHI